MLGAYCPNGKKWFEAARKYIEENAKMITEFFASNIKEAYLFPIEGTTVCWVDWTRLGIEGKELHDFFEKEAFFEVESGDVYSPECTNMTRINLSSPRHLIHEALVRTKNAIDRRKYMQV